MFSPVRRFFYRHPLAIGRRHIGRGITLALIPIMIAVVGFNVVDLVRSADWSHGNPGHTEITPTPEPTTTTTQECDPTSPVSFVGCAGSIFDAICPALQFVIGLFLGFLLLRYVVAAIARSA